MTPYIQLGRARASRIGRARACRRQGCDRRFGRAIAQAVPQRVEPLEVRAVTGLQLTIKSAQGREIGAEPPYCRRGRDGSDPWACLGCKSPLIGGWKAALSSDRGADKRPAAIAATATTSTAMTVPIFCMMQSRLAHGPNRARAQRLGHPFAACVVAAKQIEPRRCFRCSVASHSRRIIKSNRTNRDILCRPEPLGL